MGFLSLSLFSLLDIDLRRVFPLAIYDLIIFYFFPLVMQLCPGVHIGFYYSRCNLLRLPVIIIP